jgi:hypothetical protein
MIMHTVIDGGDSLHAMNDEADSNILPKSKYCINLKTKALKNLII